MAKVSTATLASPAPTQITQIGARIGSGVSCTAVRNG